MTRRISLYQGTLVRLGPIDHGKDPDILAGWTHDPQWSSFLDVAAHPLSVESVRKLLERTEKHMDEDKNFFHFTVRRNEDNHLEGLAKIFWIDFHNGTGVVNLFMGDAGHRQDDYGLEALRLLLRFAFNDLNLHRVSAWPVADDSAFTHLLEQSGFEEEGRRREASFHDGRYWDVLLMGLLRNKWEIAHE
jgi:RimJ/RimL family protein N-acetyltransferase